MTDTTDRESAPENTFDDPGLNLHTGDITASSPDADALSGRERAQQRLIQARTSVREATVRARSAATVPSRRITEPGGGGGDAPTITLADRAQAYRAHLVSAAVAVIVLVGVVLRRRAKAHRGEDVVDLGEWHLHAGPVGE